MSPLEESEKKISASFQTFMIHKVTYLKRCQFTLFQKIVDCLRLPKQFIWFHRIILSQSNSSAQVNRLESKKLNVSRYTATV